MANKICGVFESATTGLFTAWTTNNILLISLESVTGERFTAKSKANPTAHRSALQYCCCLYQSAANWLVVAAVNVNLNTVQ